MKILRLFVVTIMIATISGCYWGIKGRVIDAETQQPIEGAVVLAQWTKIHGMGLTYHTVEKIIETETDKDGKFRLEGAYSLFLLPPQLVIYKQDYVAWRNDKVFPGEKPRTDYDEWENNYVYKLERFKEGYSRLEHYYFLHGTIDVSKELVPKFSDALTKGHKDAEPEIIEMKKRQKELEKKLYGEPK